MAVAALDHYSQLCAGRGTNKGVLAKAAVSISGDGANWTPWTTFTSGAYQGRC